MNLKTTKRILDYLTGINLYINSFPNDRRPCVKFILSDHENSGGLSTLYVRFMSKASHPLESEELLSNLTVSLDNRTNEVVDGHQIVLTVLESNSPIYEGVTESGEYMYSLEVRIITLNSGGASNE